MKVKLFEMRSHMTCVPLFAFLLNSTNSKDRGIIKHSGYAVSYYTKCSNLIMGSLEYPEKSGYEACKFDTYDMRFAFKYIHENFSKLKSGSLIDVDYLMGKKDTKAKTDIFEYPLVKSEWLVPPEKPVNNESVI